MQQAAAELRYSETVFVRRESKDEYSLRYFTVTDEVDLCGHATIAAFSVVFDLETEGRGMPLGSGNEQALLVDTHGLSRYFSDISSGNEEERVSVAPGLSRERRWTAVTKAGRLNVEKCGDFVFMDMATPKDVMVMEDKELIGEIYECFGLKASPGQPDDGVGRSPDADVCQSSGVGVPGQRDSEIYHADMSGADVFRQGDSEICWLPEIISTGLPDIILPLRTTELLHGLKPDFQKMSELSERLGVTGVHAFSTEIDRVDGEIVVHCRNFAPLYGIDEEAATGTANGALMWYLCKKGVLGIGDAVCFVQGEAMKRPSRIYGRLRGENSIQVGGTCAALASGTIYLY
ncbi:phenazine biosynthesis protein PhzF [Clostridia bacterium]|nr:phenazine biosynthesis protein PhzF [Clostridia bacterium]